jgi:hypothetical protein
MPEWLQRMQQNPTLWQRMMALLGMGGSDPSKLNMMPMYNSPYGGMVSPASKAAAEMGGFYGPYYSLDGARNVPLTLAEQAQARAGQVDAMDGVVVQPMVSPGARLRAPSAGTCGLLPPLLVLTPSPQPAWTSRPFLFRRRSPSARP